MKAFIFETAVKQPSLIQNGLDHAGYDTVFMENADPALEFVDSGWFRTGQ